MVLAVALSMLLLFLYQAFVVRPGEEARRREAAFRAEQQEKAAPKAVQQDAPAPAVQTRAQALALSGARVAFDGQGMRGSIGLAGARIDDVQLREYRSKVEPGSPPVELLSPIAGPFGADAVFGWRREGAVSPLVNDTTVWSQVSEGPLRPDNPLMLRASLGGALQIERRITLKDSYLFEVTDRIENAGPEPVALSPFAYVRRKNLPADYTAGQGVHQGLVGVAVGERAVSFAQKYESARKAARDIARGKRDAAAPLLERDSLGGWIGLTEHYWLNAIIPAQNERLEAKFSVRPVGADNFFIARYDGVAREAPAGGAITYTQHYFSGAKQLELLQRYEKELSVPSLDKAVDWGLFWFLTRPLFSMLHWFYQLLGNYGLAIMAATVIIKLALFPLVNHSYKAMSKMRLLAPKQKEIQERFAGDRQRQQQEIMALFQREKVNPMAGCLPMLAPIPVFLALYKVLTVTIEIRHEPFYGWIRDLSAPDPTSWVNLFGLLPFAAPTDVPYIGALLAIGLWPILYGLAQWATMSLNPPPPDPVQARIFQFMPAVFTVIFAQFPAGLVIYWTWSNFLTMIQQYIVMRRNGVETEFDKFVMRRLRPQAQGAAAAAPLALPAAGAEGGAGAQRKQQGSKRTVQGAKPDAS